MVELLSALYFAACTRQKDALQTKTAPQRRSDVHCAEDSRYRKYRVQSITNLRLKRLLEIYQLSS